MRLSKNNIYALCFIAIQLFFFVNGCSNTPRNPNILLITIDALRADHLSLYGYFRSTSPEIDAFARQATTYENAIAQAPHTIPAVFQIMTSKYKHGAELKSEYKTLAETIRCAGYQTFAVVENPHFEVHPTACGLTRGFDRFYRNGFLGQDLIAQLYKTNTPADSITAQGIRCLKNRDPKKPFFLWLHYFDPHDIYLPPFSDEMEMLVPRQNLLITPDIRSTPFIDPRESQNVPKISSANTQHLRELYDAEVRYVDQSIGELFETMRRLCLYENTIIVITADHGESLGEHGIWAHGYSLYDPEIHVPLVIKRPLQGSNNRVREAVQSIDIAPTILELAKIPLSGMSCEGRSLIQPRAEPAFIFWNDSTVVRTSEWKLYQNSERTSLFNLRSDSGETQDVAADYPGILRGLVALRDMKLRLFHMNEESLRKSSKEVEKALRSLGYLR